MLGKSQFYALKNTSSTNYVSYRSDYRHNSRGTVGFSSQLTQKEQATLRGLTRINETDDGMNDFLVTTRQERQILNKQAEDETLREDAASTTEVESAVGNITTSVAGSSTGVYKPKNLGEFLSKTYAEKTALYEGFSADRKEVGQNLAEMNSSTDLLSANALDMMPPAETDTSWIKALKNKISEEDPDQDTKKSEGQDSLAQDTSKTSASTTTTQSETTNTASQPSES